MMDITGRIRFWFENRLGRLKLSRYQNQNSRFYSVLMYHGAENDEHKLTCRPYDLTVNAINREIDFFISQGYQMCSYIDMDVEKSTPGAGLMITFDDGHRNISQIVRHLSRYRQVRPIIAICPGVVYEQTPLWFEEIYARLLLTKNNNIHPACGTTVDPNAAYRQIMDYYLSRYTLKAADLLSMIRHSTDDVDSKQVKAHAAVHKNLDWNELGSLVDENSCTIAAHTMYHESVAHMNADEFEADINQCKELIRENLNIECAHFVYPFGDYLNDWESEVLKKCAVDFSYVVDNKLNIDPENNYRITRISGRDLSKEPGYYRYLWHQRHANLLTLN